MDRARHLAFCAFVLCVPLAHALLGAGPGVQKVWDFSRDRPGETPRGFTAATGKWEVADDGGNRVLAQRARSGDDVFNVVLVDAGSYQDVGLSVRFKAVEGELDQGGGVVWRAKDPRNYYVARFNPLENNFRVYKVAGGVRTMFKSAEVTLAAGWHTLGVTMTGRSSRCTLDGKTYLEIEDATFPDAGKIGLWSKADARTFFDDLTVRVP